MVSVERGQGFSSGVKEQFYCPLCEVLSLYGLEAVQGLQCPARHVLLIAECMNDFVQLARDCSFPPIHL